MFPLCLLFSFLPLAISGISPFAFPPRMGDPFSALGPWGRHHPPCGLPPFLHRLPVDAQDKIRAIWANYKDGDECEDEHHKTREVIHSLPDDIRYSVKSDRCGPAFLRNVSKAVRDEFKKVWFDHRLSLELKELTLKKLAYSLLTGDNLDRFSKWDQKLQLRKAEYAARVDQLSPAAKEAMESWRAIRLQERSFLSSLPKSIRDELKSVYCFHHCDFQPMPPPEAVSSTTAEPTTASTTSAVSSSTIKQPSDEKPPGFYFDVQLPEAFNADAIHCLDDY